MPLLGGNMKLCKVYFDVDKEGVHINAENIYECLEQVVHVLKVHPKHITKVEVIEDVK
jgi:hypothetical protein